MGGRCAEIMIGKLRAVCWRWSASALMKPSTTFRDKVEWLTFGVTRRGCGGAARVHTVISVQWSATGLGYSLGRAMEFSSGNYAADK